MGKHQSSSERLHKLLQQLKRQFVSYRSGSERPPDAAAAALGKAIARECLLVTGDEKKQGGDDDAVLRALCTEGLNPSVPHSFFEAITQAIISNPRANNYSWLPQWMLQMEEVVREQQQGRHHHRAAPLEGLVACIRTCAIFLAYVETKQKEKREDSAFLIGSTFDRLQLTSSRVLLVREIIPAVFEASLSDRAIDRIPQVLSPLLVATVLSRPKSPLEGVLFLQHIWRAMWAQWPLTTVHDCLGLLGWITFALNIFLLSPQHDMDESAASLELAESWFMELIHLARDLMDDNPASRRDEEHRQLTHWLDGILRDSLPRIMSSSFNSSHFVWKPLLDALVDLTGTFDNTIRPIHPLDPVLVLRLASLVLATPLTVERRLLLQLFSSNFCAPRISVSGDIVRKLLLGLSSVFVLDEDTRKLAMALQSTLASSSSVPTAVPTSKESDDVDYGSCLSTLLAGTRGAGTSLIDTVLHTAEFLDSDLPVSQQITAQLIGISQQQQHNSIANKEPNGDGDSYQFLKRLIQQYPHLSIAIMPITLEQIHNASAKGDGHGLVKHLEFLSESLVLDSCSAQEVWNLVGVQWLQEHTPLSVRTMLIRLLPNLCVANKRMYRRVVERLGACLDDKQPEIRLAVAATISDLAKEDCIRDVSDVIGWIQKLLTEERALPMHSLIVHYAILSLHYLVRSGELEFGLVMKVLSKKLCPIDDTVKLLELPLVVLESLVLLLGDGEVAESSEDEDAAATPTVKSVSPQVASSVSALVAIGRELQNKAIQGAGNKIRSRKVLENIFKSLSGYSFEALGIDEEVLKTAVEEMEIEEEKTDKERDATRYHDLRELIVGGLEGLVTNDNAIENEPVVLFARKVVVKEEELMASSLWHSKGLSRKQTRSTRDAKLNSDTTLAALPPADGLSRTPLATPPLSLSIATLFSSDGSHLTAIRDNADSAIESSDPLFVVFSVNAFLFATRLYHLTSTESIGSILEKVREWYEVFLSPDAMYLVVAAFSVSIAEKGISSDGDMLLDQVTQTHDEVLDAFKTHSFQKEDIAKICLGVSAMSCLQCGALERVRATIGLLENSVRGYGGQQEFGAYFALSLIAQAAPKALHGKGLALATEDATNVITRICGFLVEELLSCFEEVGDVFVNLVACLKSGKATSDLVQSLEDLGSNSVSLLMTKHVVAEYLLISCALCLPALATVDDVLLLATFRLIETFEWAGGKGIALSAVIRKCAEAKLLSQQEFEQIQSEYASVFDKGLDSTDESLDADGLDDIFYAFNSMCKQSTPHYARSLLVGNSDIFDDDGCAMSLLACVSSIASIPALGISSFTEEPVLRAGCTEVDVSSVVRIVSQAASLGDGSKYCAMGVVLLGFLSSIKSQSETPLFGEPSDGDKGESANSKATNTTIPTINFRALPHPRLGTVSAALVSMLEGAYDAAMSEFDGVYTHAGAMCAMESLTVPGQYAKAFLEVILFDITAGKLPALRLLVSQIRGRRSAIHDGRDFVSLAVSVTTDPQSWSKMLDEESERFLVQYLADILPKLPVESLKESLSNIWTLCSPSREGRDEMAVLFLSSFRHLLQSAVLSPKAVTAMREYVLGKLFADVSARPLDMGMARIQGSQSLLDAYTNCVVEVPVAMLDEARFFIYSTQGVDFSGELFRALLSLKLSQLDYFPSNRGNQEISSAMSWLSRSLTSSDETRRRDSLRRLFCVFAVTTSRDDSTSKQNRLRTLFEILLLTNKETSAVGLELLGIVLTYWNRGEGSSASLSLGYLLNLSEVSIEALPILELDHTTRIAVEEIPLNLTGFAESEKLRAVVSHQLHRLHTQWSEFGVEGQLLDIVKRTIFSCRDMSAKAGTFEALASLSLSTISYRSID